jgi:hypothetical protein
MSSAIGDDQADGLLHDFNADSGERIGFFAVELGEWQRVLKLDVNMFAEL